MTTATDLQPDLDPAELREQMVRKLIADGHITTDAVAAAFRAVPRHRFMLDGVELAIAYDAGQSPVTKRNAAGQALSSVSAPWLQAVMIEQARIRPGARVLELGSGGYNAALMAEIVGAAGRVVSVDIDGEIIDRASRRLDETGYGRIRVVQADGNQPIPGEAIFDVVLVTVGAWDIPPAWVEQLAPDGILVVPLVMGGVTRSIAFRRDGHRLRSLSAEVCGFVAMQGEGQHVPTEITLADPQGRTTLSFDGPPPAGLNLTPGLLADTPVEVWSGETIGNMIDWSDMYLWFACYMPGLCHVTAPDDSPLRTPGKFFFPKGNASRDSLAMFVIRNLDDGSGCEWGARGYGHHAEQAADEMVGHIQRWNRTAGPRRKPTYTYERGALSANPAPGTAVLVKRHGSLLVHWPTDTSGSA
ncbi:methyltransferase, FxLD system [Catellatospora sp. NPDC049111]|uniref:methyltransferase, FxLD system n=1 Tax=Catellatospora sp. NPDC049111 TaxID=3155271 RepID=UPI00340AF129